MNSYDRCRAALEWRAPDRVPVIPQNSVMAIRLAGYDLIEGSREAPKLAGALMASRERFGYDGIMLGADAAILAEALGCEVAYRSDDPPAVVGPAIRDLSELGKLRIPDMGKDGRLPVWAEAARLIRERLGRSVFLAGRADQGAFSLAALVLGMEELSLLIAARERMDEVSALLDFCNEVHIAFAKAMAAAGVDMTTSGDAYAGPGLIGPLNYEELAQPRELAAARRIQSETGLPYSIHICGDTGGIHESLSATGAACLEVDHRTDIVALRKATYGRNAILGNLDTGLLCDGTAEEVEKACAALMAVMGRGGGFILSSGCSMGANSSPDLLSAMVESARRHGAGGAA